MTSYPRTARERYENHRLWARTYFRWWRDNRSASRDPFAPPGDWEEAAAEAFSDCKEELRKAALYRKAAGVALDIGPQEHGEMTTLGNDLPKEMARVRDVVIPQYQSIGPVGGFAISMMRAALDRAAVAMAEGDVAKMIAAYQDLKSYES